MDIYIQCKMLYYVLILKLQSNQFLLTKYLPYYLCNAKKYTDSAIYGQNEKPRQSSQKPISKTLTSFKEMHWQHLIPSLIVSLESNLDSCLFIIEIEFAHFKLVFTSKYQKCNLTCQILIFFPSSFSLMSTNQSSPFFHVL